MKPIKAIIVKSKTSYTAFIHEIPGLVVQASSSQLAQEKLMRVYSNYHKLQLSRTLDFTEEVTPFGL